MTLKTLSTQRPSKWINYMVVCQCNMGRSHEIAQWRSLRGRSRFHHDWCCRPCDSRGSCRWFYDGGCDIFRHLWMDKTKVTGGKMGSFVKIRLEYATIFHQKKICYFFKVTYLIMLFHLFSRYIPQWNIYSYQILSS